MNCVPFLLFLLFSSLEKNDFVSAEPCGSAGTTCTLVCVDDFQCDSKTIDDDVCTLEGVGFSGSFGSTDLDLSGLSMALNGIMANLFDDVKSLVLSLNLSGNVFCQDQHTRMRRIVTSSYSKYGYHESHKHSLRYTTYMGVADIVETFPNLKSLDLSNTLKWRVKSYHDSPMRQHLGKIWEKKRSLTFLDISDNANRAYLKSDDFAGMVNLRSLNMSKCCSSIYDRNGSLLHDLVNVEKLDLSYTQWSSVNLYFLYPMMNLKNINLSHWEFSNDDCPKSNYGWSSRRIPPEHTLPFSSLFRRHYHLETIDLSSQECSLNASKFRFVSKNISTLLIKDNYLLGFHLLKTSFGLPNPAALRKLDLSGSTLTDSESGAGPFPEDLVNLEELILKESSGFVKSLNSPHLQNQRNLKTLDLSSVYLDGFNNKSANVFQSLDGLQTLIMRGTRVSGNLILGDAPKIHSDYFAQQMPDYDFYNNKTGNPIPNIETIDLSHSTMSRLVVTGYKNLKTLDLGGSQIGNLFLANLSNLENLNLNSITVRGSMFLSGLVPDAFTMSRNDGLSKIRSLNITNCEIDTLELVAINNLQFLDLTHSDIKTLILSHLEQLESLNLDFASVSRIVVSNLPNLANLEMASSKITEFEIDGLPYIRYLNASSIQNGIEKLKLANFESLEILDLSDCGIYELPENSFANLTKLKSLKLSNNALDQLPKKLFSETKRLDSVSIDLSNNYIRAFPLVTFKPIMGEGSDWTIDLSRNLIDCDDCTNSWLADRKYSSNLIGAKCTSPIGKYNESVSMKGNCY